MKTKYVNGNSQKFKDDPCESLKTALLITAGFKNSSLTPASKEKLAVFKALVLSKLKDAKCGKKKVSEPQMPPAPPVQSEKKGFQIKNPRVKFSSQKFKNKVKELQSKIKNLESRPNNTVLLESVQQRERNLSDEVKRLRNTTVPKNVANAAEALVSNLRQQLANLQTSKNKNLSNYQKLLQEKTQLHEELQKATGNKETELRNKLAQKNVEVSDFKKSVELKARTIVELLKKVGNKSEQRKQELESRLVDIRALEERVEQLSQKSSTNQTTLNSLQKELAHFQNMSKANKKMLNFYKVKQGEAQANANKLRGEYKELLSKHEELEKSLGNKNATEAQKKVLASQVEQYARNREDLVRQMSELQKKYETQERELQNKVSSLGESNTARQEAQKALAQLVRDREALKGERNAVGRTLQELKAVSVIQRVVRARRANKQLNTLRVNYEKRLANLARQRGSNANARLKAAQEQHARNLANLVSQKQKEFEQVLAGKNSNKEAQLAELRGELEKIRREQQVNKQALQQVLETKNKERLALVSEYNKLVQEKKNTQSVVEELRKLDEIRASELAKLQTNMAKQISNLKSATNLTTQEKNKQISTLQEQLRALENKQKRELDEAMARHKSALQKTEANKKLLANLKGITEKTPDAVSRLSSMYKNHEDAVKARVRALLSGITNKNLYLSTDKAKLLLGLLKNEVLRDATGDVLNFSIAARYNYPSGTYNRLKSNITKFASIMTNLKKPNKRGDGLRKLLEFNETKRKPDWVNQEVPRSQPRERPVTPGPQLTPQQIQNRNRVRPSAGPQIWKVSDGTTVKPRRNGGKVPTNPEARKAVFEGLIGR